MNKLAMAILLYLGLGLEQALKGAMGLGDVGVGPSVLFAIVACLAAYAPNPPAGTMMTLGAAFVAGLGTDLTSPYGAEFIVGPHMLGFALGAYACMQLRGFVLRRNPFAIAFLAVLGCIPARLLSLALLYLRQAVIGNVDLPHAGLLWPFLGSALYTALPALLLALVWRRLLPLLGLPDPFSRQTFYGRNPL